MRNVLAAGFAALVVVAAAVLGWQAVSQRAQPEDATPDVPIDALVAALEAGPDGAVASSVREGGDELADAVAAFATGLTVDAWTVERGPIGIDGATATAPLTVTLATSEVGEVSWETRVQATRIRGEWGIDADASTFHPDMRPGLRVVVERSEVTRAPIVDREGKALTTHGDARSIGVSPERIINEDRLFQVWAEVLPESVEDLDELLRRDDLQPSWFYPLVTVSDDRYEEIGTRLRSVPGVIARDAEDASPTGGQFATHVLGRVGQPTAEQAADLGVPADAVVGLRGLEQVFEDQLVGSARARALIVESDDDEVAELGTTQADASGPVATTLDTTVQQAVENALTGVTENAAVVVVDGDDGAIRGSASRPIEGYNRAWEGNYPPGDAFLPVTAEALLSGDTTLGEPATCPAQDTVAGAAFESPRPLDGEVELGQALAAGCDTTLARAAASLETDDLLGAAERFGIGTEFDLPLPSATSQLPTPVDPTELVRAAAGQARVLASPLHMATIVAAAGEGTWHAPHLVRDDHDATATTELSGTAIEDLQRLLELGGRGTGSGSGFDELGGAGFVGTAPVTGDSAVHAWAVLEVDGMGVAVLVEDTGGDEAPARGIAERFLRELSALRG